MQKTYIRKHANHMTAKELSIVEIATRGLCREMLEEVSLTDHAKQQTHRYSREITLQSIKNCLRNFNEVIEFSYNYNYNDRRVVIRDANGICLVLSMRYKNVVTVWHNFADDNHETLDESDYVADMNIMDFLHDGFSYNGLTTKNDVVADVVEYIFLGLQN